MKEDMISIIAYLVNVFYPVNVLYPMNQSSWENHFSMSLIHLSALFDNVLKPESLLVPMDYPMTIYFREKSPLVKFKG